MNLPKCVISFLFHLKCIYIIIIIIIIISKLEVI